MKKILKASPFVAFAACAILNVTFISSSHAENTKPAKIALCTSCHVDTGNSVNPLWPNLAGQHATYMKNQLIAFKEGKRQDPLMAPIVKSLTNKDIDELSNYYSSLDWPKTSTSPSQNSKGQNVAANCIGCHGMAGKPVNDDWPIISGLSKEYILKSLKGFKSGERESLPMKVIVDSLTEEQLEAVSEYYGSN